MQSIETEGETIDAAIDKALQGLGVPRERVEIQILADATRGLLGFGGTKARVRASLRPALADTLSAAADVSRETSVNPSAVKPPMVSRETSASRETATSEGGRRQAQPRPQGGS